jgi:hypothetical protein
MTLNEHLTNQDKLDKEQLAKLKALRYGVKNDASSTYYYLDAENIMEAIDETEGAKGRVSTFVIENRADDLMTFIKETSLKYWLAFVERKVEIGLYF